MVQTNKIGAHQNRILVKRKPIVSRGSSDPTTLRESKTKRAGRFFS